MGPDPHDGDVDNGADLSAGVADDELGLDLVQVVDEDEHPDY